VISVQRVEDTLGREWHGGALFLFAKVLRRIPYPVEPLGFGRVQGDLLAPLLDRDRDSSGQVPKLTAEVNHGLEDQLKRLHSDTLIHRQPRD